MKPISALRNIASLAFCLVACGLDTSAQAQGVHITTFHGDEARLGWNRNEVKLSPQTVNPNDFGKIWEVPLDGQIYGSPLHISNLNIKGKKRDVLYTGTEKNNVYALDAVTGEILWQKTVAPYLNEAQYNDCNNIRPYHGITSTPVIDLGRKTIYVCGVTQPGIRQAYRVWALDILTGEIKKGYPQTLKGHYKGLDFDAGQLTQRGALNLVKGWLYIPFGSRCDVGEWHGWVIGLNVQDPSSPQRAFTPAPTIDGGGMWGSAGVSADRDGNLFAVTGNGGLGTDRGSYDLDTGGENVCESILKLIPTGSEIRMTKDKRDYYVPGNFKFLDATDQDMGGSSGIVLPDIGGRKLLVTCGKDGFIYMVDRDNLGGVGGELHKQRLFGDPKAFYHSNIKTTPAFFDGGDTNKIVYVSGNETGPKGEAGVVAMRIDTSQKKPKLETAWTLKKTLNQPGAPTVSSNGHKDAIVWVIESNKNDGDSGEDGVLHAYDALTGQELYHSNMQAKRDVLKDARKFSCPTVANGRVYVGTEGIVAYGNLREKMAQEGK